MILVSFCRILHGLSDEINLFWRCSSPLRVIFRNLAITSNTMEHLFLFTLYRISCYDVPFHNPVQCEHSLSIHMHKFRSLNATSKLCSIHCELRFAYRRSQFQTGLDGRSERVSHDNAVNVGGPGGTLLTDWQGVRQEENPPKFFWLHIASNESIPLKKSHLIVELPLLIWIGFECTFFKISRLNSNKRLLLHLASL